MSIPTTDQQEQSQAAFRAFADEHIAPCADRIDREQSIPRELLTALADHGYLCPTLPDELGGADMDMVTYGMLAEQIGRACSSVRSVLTVHDMVAHALHRCANDAQKQTWLPRLALGRAIAAFALTEPNVGSDAGNIESTADETPEAYVLNGEKKWITFGQHADVFLVFARLGDKLSAFLLERSTPGLTIEPIDNMLGLRGSHLAKLTMIGCPVPKDRLVAGAGAGFAMVGAIALDLGRYSVACGCVGVGQACLDASLQYAQQRRQFGKPLLEHQLIQRMIADMHTNVAAARLLCRHAGHLKDAGRPEAVMAGVTAKYFASTMLARVTADAVQIHGANGCGGDYPVERYFRDAKIMQIIEGSTEIIQTLLAGYAYEAAR